MALIQPHAAVRCPALAERALARGRRNVLVRHGSRSRRGGDGRGPGWWGSRARVRRVVWHAPRSPRVPSSMPPLVIALPEPVRRPCPSLPRPLGPCREDLCARARASARRFFPPHFFACQRARARGKEKQKEPQSQGTGPTNQHHRKNRSINHSITQSRQASPAPFDLRSDLQAARQQSVGRRAAAGGRSGLPTNHIARSIDGDG